MVPVQPPSHSPEQLSETTLQIYKEWVPGISEGKSHDITETIHLKIVSGCEMKNMISKQCEVETLNPEKSLSEIFYA